ncbi:uncharacterized protein BBA_00206 [Beauveria bassiana ARSEF 2860]|uniref:Uncharacterized protein n=1 Tax=Beauveria bassiana (strain ARSEF 2860) TaxID=655819 RepID=J5K8X3_BEAB2|nr:uncharacterized protein BBA_00206 [Beauveria bassiana ARSEF 2860]EJP70576.1 hypothetical protein BBA_00206 [Beauveria bassiana ARSEF 2860]
MTPEAAGLRFPLQFVENAQQKDEIQSWDAKSDCRSMAAKGTRNQVYGDGLGDAWLQQVDMFP